MKIVIKSKSGETITLHTSKKDVIVETETKEFGEIWDQKIGETHETSDGRFTIVIEPG